MTRKPEDLTDEEIMEAAKLCKKLPKGSVYIVATEKGPGITVEVFDRTPDSGTIAHVFAEGLRGLLENSMDDILEMGAERLGLEFSEDPEEPPTYEVKENVIQVDFGANKTRH